MHLFEEFLKGTWSKNVATVTTMSRARDQIPTYSSRTGSCTVLEAEPVCTTLESLPTVLESVPAYIAL